MGDAYFEPWWQPVATVLTVSLIWFLAVEWAIGVFQ